MRLFKPTFTDRQTGAKKHTSKYYAEFTDHRHTRRRIPAYTDKTASAKFGQKLERLAAHRSARDPLPADLRQWLESLPRATARRLAEWGLIDRAGGGGLVPIAEHLNAFRAYLTGGGATEQHVKLTTARAERVVEGCGFKYWSDISGGRVLTFLNGLRGDTESRRGISAQTFNFYLQAVKQFGRFMVQDGRATESPLAHLKAVNVRTDRRHDRRAFTLSEAEWLLTTTEGSPDVRCGMDGPRRALCYRLGMETGARAGELDSLTRESFDLDASPPVMHIAATASKRRRADRVYLRPDTAARLRDVMAMTFPAQALFTIKGRGARMIRADIAEARRAYIQAAPNKAIRGERKASGFLVYRDRDGKVLDFHSTRHTCATMLAASGAHPKTAQAILRHSTIGLTMNLYTHGDDAQEAAAVAALPELRATGTEGVKSCLPTCLPNARDIQHTAMNSNIQNAISSGAPLQKAEMLGNGQYSQHNGSIGQTVESRRDGREVDGGGFENRCRVTPTGGSNPSPSARDAPPYRR
jgi:integrase